MCEPFSNVSLIVWAKSQDSVHKPPFLKRKESRSGSNRGSAYQHSALPLGHSGSHRDLTGLFVYHLEEAERKERKERGSGRMFCAQTVKMSIMGHKA